MSIKPILFFIFLLISVHGALATYNVTTDLRSVDENNWIGTSFIYSLEYDASRDLVYIGAQAGKFGVYNRTSNVSTNLSGVDENNWIGNTASVYSMRRDTTRDLLYLGTSAGGFGVYNRTSNVSTNLSGVDENNWIGTSFVMALEIDETRDLVYIASQAGKFGVYNRTSNVSTNLSGVDENNWIGTSNVNALAYDSVHDLVYIGAQAGKFGVYNRTSNVSTNLSGTDPGNWMGTSDIYEVVYDQNTDVVYLGLAGGKFGVYNRSTNITSDLSATDPSNWMGSNTVYEITIDVVRKVLYLAIDLGFFGKYTQSTNITNDLSATDTSNWMGSQQLLAITFDSTSSLVYVGGESGLFGVYDTNVIPPTNSWNSQSYVGSYAIQFITASYCTAGTNPITNYYSNSSVFLILSNGSVNYSNNTYANAGVHDVNISCYDGTTNATATTRFNLTYAAPTNSWASNNQTFNHNTSKITGGYCTDADGETLSYWSNNSALPILSNGSVNFTANISSSGVHLVNLTCGDGITNTSRTAQFNITNTAPANSWASNPQTFSHGTARITSEYCDDADGDSLTYSSNNSMLPIISNGSVNFTNTSLLNVGSYSVLIGCSDSVTNSTATAVFNLTNAVPNVTSANITVLPAEAGVDLNLSYSCSDADGDTCNASVFYAWYKNGASLNITSVTLGSGNFTTNDNITGSIRVYDGLENSSWLNTSTATIGDTIAPVLGSLNLSRTSVSIPDQTVNISVSCTDANSISRVYAEITDPAMVKFNWTMSSAGGSLYAYNYAPGLPGTHTVTTYCIDGNSNVGTGNTDAFVVSQSTTAGGGGGGGGGYEEEITPLGGVTVIQPASQEIKQPFCKAGGTAPDIPLVIFNPIATKTTYEFTIGGVQCDALLPVTVEAKSTASLTLKNCECPKSGDEIVEGTIRIDDKRDEKAFTRIPITLKGSSIGGPAFILVVAGGIVFLAAITGLLVMFKR